MLNANIDRELVTRRTIVSGNVVEVIEYEYGYVRGGTNNARGGRKSQNITEGEKQNNREKVAQRAKTRVRRLANANPQLSKFLTLTFAGNQVNQKQANKEFKNFILRLNYYCKKNGIPKVECIAVVEFQKRGAVHFHL